MPLFDYMRDTQRLIRDSRQEQIDPGDLVIYVNKARREVAMRSMCVRLLTPISGSIMGISVTAAGGSYTNPSVTISTPDFPSGQGLFPNGAQATAQATEVGGTIAAVNVTLGGYGYFKPIITINDPTGSGATAVVNQMSFINQLSRGLEVYPFSAVDLSAFPGYGSIYMVKSLSVVYANYRYSLPCYSFSTYQAMIRQYTAGVYQYVPTFCAQYGRGTAGSFYVYPLPSQQYQFELDSFCLPQDLETDQDVDVIPQPYTDAVPFLAAYYAANEMQAFNNARYFKNEFDEWVKRYGGYTLPGRVSNPYGRF